MKPNITFDSSLSAAVQTVREFFPEAEPESFRFVRDITGQIHVLVPDDVPQDRLEELGMALHDETFLAMLEEAISKSCRAHAGWRQQFAKINAPEKTQRQQRLFNAFAEMHQAVQKLKETKQRAAA